MLVNFSHGVLCSWLRREGRKANVTSISFYGLPSEALARRRDFKRQNNELHVTGVDEAKPQSGTATDLRARGPGREHRAAAFKGDS